MSSLGKFIKKQRKAAGLTQIELADKSGLGLRFVREAEQGKESLRLDKVNQLLHMFGYAMGPVRIAPMEEQEAERRS